MTDFNFDDFARTTLNGARNSFDDTALTSRQMAEVMEYMRSPGSGPDASSSYADYVKRMLEKHPPELPAGMDYVAFSGKDSAAVYNATNASQYTKDVGRAGLIGDTPWGTFVDGLQKENTPQHQDFIVMEDRLRNFMEPRGIVPLGKDYAGALQDIMWNAGSPKYFENAIATGKPLLAFVENAPPNRGFSNFELATALEHPDVRINGYPVSAFGPDPRAFVSRSAAEYQALERTVAQQATINSGHAVDVAHVRRHLTPIEGWDAVNKTLFSRPVDEFHSLNLADMTRARADWVAARPQMATGPRLYADVAELTPHAPRQPGAPRGPPGAAPAAEIAGDAAQTARVSPGMKVAGAAGVALLAHDFATSGHKWVELNAQGNAAGADSTAAHFIGRNVGGAVGGFVAGAGVGLATGSWTGPGALATGIGGGAVGAILGERWADQKDIDRIYTQIDPMGRAWTRDPADAEGRWLRAAHQQQVQSSDTGTGVEVRPVQTAQGDDVTFRASYVASGTLERQLNWQAARASYELGLATPPIPQDPYRLSASAADQPPRGPFESGRTLVRDPQSSDWTLEIKETLDGRIAVTRNEPVSPERALALDEQARTVIAQNAANTPAAMAARYMVAHAQQRWSDFGDSDNPSIPNAIQRARASADTLKASDGADYTRQADGRWVNEGRLYDTAANRNLTEELDVTWRSQNAGVDDMTTMAEGIRSKLELAPEGIRGQVAALYVKHGIERSEAQLAVTSAAVEQNLASNGRQPYVVLELMPDPRTHAPSSESAIAAFSDAGGNRMVLTATTTFEDVVKFQASQQQASAPVRATGPVPTLDTVIVRPDQQAPTHDAPELRIEALSPHEQDAHRQALHEANRQGASTTEAQQAAVVAAHMANGSPTDTVRAQTTEQDGTRERDTGRNPGPAVQPAFMPTGYAAGTATAGTVAAATAPAPVVAPAPRPTSAEVPTQTETQRAAPSTPAADPSERQRQEATSAQRREEAAREHTSARPAAIPAAMHDPLTQARRAELQQEGDAGRSEMPGAVQPKALADAEAIRQTVRDRAPPPSAHDALAGERTLPADGSIRVASTRPQDPTGMAAATAMQARERAGRSEYVPMPPEPIAHDAMPKPEVAHVERKGPEQLDRRDFELYQQVRQGVAALDTKHGRSFDESSERMSASLLVLAKDNDLSRVDHVLLSNATERNPAGHTLYVVQGEPSDPAHLRASMPTAQAAMAPVAESMQQFAVVSQHAEQRAISQQLDQQAETERMQQGIQARTQGMG